MKRRTALGLIGAAAAAPLVRAPAARAGEYMDLDPSNPQHTLMITRKLAHSMDGAPFFWWAQLLRVAVIDKISTPLWNVHVAAVLRTRDVDDQGPYYQTAYETTAISMVYYTDLQTGEFMEAFNNPFTGQEVEVSYFPARPATQVRSVDESHEDRPAGEGFRSIRIHPLGPAVIEADDVWVRDDAIFRMEPNTPEAGRPFRGNDWSTYHGALKDVADPLILNAPATWHFNDILSYPPWMGMGDRPGDYVSRGFGRKVSSFDAMPVRLQELIRTRHPEIHEDPAGALEG